MNESSANVNMSRMLKIGDTNMAFSTGSKIDPWTVPNKRSQITDFFLLWRHITIYFLATP